VKHLYVWVRLPDGEIRLAGELAATDPIAGGRFESEFEYSREWMAAPAGFALDPESLPLSGGPRFRGEQFHPPLAVFDDALPDDWGRRLLTLDLKAEGRTPSPPEMLQRLQGGGTGALIFTAPSERPPPPRPTQAGTSLATLVAAAAEFEAGALPSGDAFRKLLEGSSRVGGARPKALVHDEGGEWLAKFPSQVRDGAYDVVGLEATCLELARHAGLVVPEFRLQSVGRRRVLMVKRFDVTPHGGRIHMVSLRALCKERPGIFVTSYSELARMLERHSATPAGDVAMLFRHMAFNAAIGNVDDHTKNFWMIASPAGYRLAPAFDLVPDVTGRGDHTLTFQYSATCPTREQIETVARDWRVARAAAILDQIIDAASAFTRTARKLAVRGGPSLEAVRTDVRRRVKLLSP
jgi:serine/threonine-protein kinase HipA